MDWLQHIDLSIVALVLCGLCLGGGALVILLNLIGGVFGFVFNIFELFGHILSGGPFSWCGCLLVLFGCGGCACIVAFTVSIFSTCGTPDAVRFCTLLGR
jgi:hypothetical protein